ncbi:uncharacterised protein [Saccharolobus solfataricus]|uniref:DUF2175 domain-containing protein n=3 Tax=Saccharolobus solfataricus TaxID=2287 RepID=A0A157SXH9_SACSO|nr:uncharacterised protein [Saccharolobus solfataricus]
MGLSKNLASSIVREFSIIINRKAYLHIKLLLSMSRPATKWKCVLCNNTIYWDELFTYLKNGVSHYTCLRDKAIRNAKIDSKELTLLLDSLEEELKSIVSYKQKLSSLQNEEAKKTLDQIEKDAEKNAGILTRLIEKFSDLS